MVVFRLIIAQQVPYHSLAPTCCVIKIPLGFNNSPYFIFVEGSMTIYYNIKCFVRIKEAL